MTLVLRQGLATLVAALALAGCGDDDDAAPTAPPPPPAPDAGTTPPPPAGSSIADIATRTPGFTMLVAAADRAGLVGVLDSPGSYTVFAPTDEAFEASGITMDAIAAMPSADLARILTYHAIGAEVPSSAAVPGPADTLAGFSVIIGTDDGVTINGGNAVRGGANVVTADIEADNGVIHVIDRVLLPPTVADLARYAGLGALSGAVEAANLGEALAGEGPFTVFAPTDAAFAELSAVPSGDALAQVLLYHVVGASVASDAVPARAPSLATNAYGDALTLLFDTSSGVSINGGSRVVAANVRGTNGIVHVVDRVILPMDAVDAASAAGFDALVSAVAAAAPLPDGTSVASALSARAPYTIFAPTDDAFAAISATLAGLTAEQVRDVLLHHVLSPTAFPEPVLASELPGAPADFDTIQGTTIRFDPMPEPTVDGARIVVTDIVVTNGVIHAIDAVMVP